MTIDLHLHTTASDGTQTPSEVVSAAATIGLRAIAITDHDSVEGIAEALEAARTTPGAPIVIPGVELSAVHDDSDVHVLGYFVDHTDAGFLEHLEDLRAARMRRAEAIVHALADGGFSIDIAHVLALSSGAAVGRSHVARALVEQGLAADVTDAFKRLLGRGRPFYVPKDVRTPTDVIAAVNAAGGIAVLAHPGVTRSDHLPALLAPLGLTGIEAYHSEHDEEMRARYSELARELGLIVTGGTDYHGPHSPNGDMGSVEVPDGTLEALYAAAGRSVPETDGGHHAA